MGVQELPDGEPNPLQFQTTGAYAKAYIDWAIGKRVSELEARLTKLEHPAALEAA